MVIMVVTGGKGTLAGPIVGGIIFGIVPQLLRDTAGPEVQWIIYGILMIVIVYFLPKGIVPALRNRWQRRRDVRDAGIDPLTSAPAARDGGA
jgi:branched-chain amino acid transport system permease protein